MDDDDDPPALDVAFRTRIAGVPPIAGIAFPPDGADGCASGVTGPSLDEAPWLRDEVDFLRGRVDALSARLRQSEAERIALAVEREALIDDAVRCRELLEEAMRARGWEGRRQATFGLGCAPADAADSGDLSVENARLAISVETARTSFQQYVSESRRKAREEEHAMEELRQHNEELRRRLSAATYAARAREKRFAVSFSNLFNPEEWARRNEQAKMSESDHTLEMRGGRKISESNHTGVTAMLSASGLNLSYSGHRLSSFSGNNLPDDFFDNSERRASLKMSTTDRNMSSSGHGLSISGHNLSFSGHNLPEDFFDHSEQRASPMMSSSDRITSSSGHNLSFSGHNLPDDFFDNCERTRSAMLSSLDQKLAASGHNLSDDFFDNKELKPSAELAGGCAVARRALFGGSAPSIIRASEPFAESADVDSPAGAFGGWGPPTIEGSEPFSELADAEICSIEQRAMVAGGSTITSELSGPFTKLADADDRYTAQMLRGMSTPKCESIESLSRHDKGSCNVITQRTTIGQRSSSAGESSEPLSLNAHALDSFSTGEHSEPLTEPADGDGGAIAQRISVGKKGLAARKSFATSPKSCPEAVKGSCAIVQRAVSGGITADSDPFIGRRVVVGRYSPTTCNDDAGDEPSAPGAKIDDTEDEGGEAAEGVELMAPFVGRGEAATWSPGGAALDEFGHVESIAARLSSITFDEGDLRGRRIPTSLDSPWKRTAEKAR